MSTSTSSPQPSPSLPVRLGRLCVAAAVFWVLYLVTPIFVESFPPLREYARVVEETGIMPGALFYTDIPQSIEAEFNNRDAIRYFVKQKRNSSVVETDL